MRQSSLFLTRLLNLLRQAEHNHHHVRLTAEFRKDVQWWKRFLLVNNGVSLIGELQWSAPDMDFSTDACLTGCGGLSSSEYFHSVLLEFPHIHHRELLALIIAVRLWCHAWAGKRLRVYCDNVAVVQALNSGRVKDPLLARGLRELWFYLSVNECGLRAVRLFSTANRAADILSRWHLNGEHSDREFHLMVEHAQLQERIVSPENYAFNDFV